MGERNEPMDGEKKGKEKEKKVKRKWGM